MPITRADVGPCYTAADLNGCPILPNLLALTYSAEDERLYPAFQFLDPTDPREGLVIGLPRTLALLSEHNLRPEDVADWLTTPREDLDMMRPIDWLREERDPSYVYTAATI